jgi:4-hydroxy-tetrahydrodipicolinate synthase
MPAAMLTLDGSMVALATPFKGGAFDEAAYRELIRFQLENGTQGLVPIGTTGEAVTLSAAERAQAVKVSVEMARGKALVIAGAGSNSTQEAIDSVRRVRELGADAALVVTPYYNKPTQNGLVEHYRAIAQANPGYPLVAYNVPSRTSVDLLPETCVRLCEIPEVVALKEATASMARAVDLLERCGERLTLLSGDDFTVLPFIACGGKGVISVSANVVPRRMADLVKASRAGDWKKAQALQVDLNALHRLLFVETSPSPVKWALHAMGKFGPEIRLPLVRLTESNAAKLEAEMKRLGIL